MFCLLTALVSSKKTYHTQLLPFSYKVNVANSTGSTGSYVSYEKAFKFLSEFATYEDARDFLDFVAAGVCDSLKKSRTNSLVKGSMYYVNVDEKENKYLVEYSMVEYTIDINYYAVHYEKDGGSVKILDVFPQILGYDQHEKIGEEIENILCSYEEKMGIKYRSLTYRDVYLKDVGYVSYKEISRAAEEFEKLKAKSKN